MVGDELVLHKNHQAAGAPEEPRPLPVKKQRQEQDNPQNYPAQVRMNIRFGRTVEEGFQVEGF